MVNYRYPKVIFLVLVGVVLSWPTQTTAAVSTKVERGLTLSPLRKELSIVPGTSLEGTLEITNRTSAPMQVTTSASTFKVINEQYDYKFIDNDEPAKWVRFLEDGVTLKPHEERTLTYQVAVPLKAEPGGRYISLFASSNTQSDSLVPSKQRVASLLYVTVEGPVTRTGHFLGLESPWLTAKYPDWSARIRNSGTTHFRSRYTVTLKSVLGKTLEQQNEDALILPGTVRLVGDTVKIRWPGVYQVEYLIGLGDSPAHKEQRWVVYSPPYATSMLVGAIGILIVVIVQRLHRRRNT